MQLGVKAVFLVSFAACLVDGIDISNVVSRSYMSKYYMCVYKQLSEQQSIFCYLS